MAISSINFQKATAHAFRHNDRSDKVTYLVDRSDENEVARSAEEAKALADQLYADAIAKLTAAKVKRKPKAENSRWEAVVNLNAGHTLEDVQRLAKRIEEETGFTVLQIAVHKDEGKSASDKNYHAHIVFHTLDRNTGRQLYRREHMTAEKLTALQDLTAETLGMQRGKRGSKRKRLNHAEYKAVAQEREAQQERIEQLETELANVKDVAAQYKAERDALKASGEAKQSDYQALKKQYDGLKAHAKAGELTIDALKAAAADLATAAGVTVNMPDGGRRAVDPRDVTAQTAPQIATAATATAERRTAKFKEQAEIIERQREIIDQQREAMKEDQDAIRELQQTVERQRAAVPAPDYIAALEADSREKKRLQAENASLKKELQQAKAKIADLEAQLKERSTMRERQSDRRELNIWQLRKKVLIERMAARYDDKSPSMMKSIEDTATQIVDSEKKQMFDTAKHLYKDEQLKQQHYERNKQIEQEYYQQLKEDPNYDPFDDSEEEESIKGPGM